MTWKERRKTKENAQLRTVLNGGEREQEHARNAGEGED